jgi:hypothetical protein
VRGLTAWWGRATDWAMRPAGGPRRWRWWHSVVTVVCLGLAGMWVYAFFIADQTNPNRIKDREWAAASEALCARARATISALPPANTAKTPQDRALVVDQANQILVTLVNQLSIRIPAGADRDRSYVAQWLADWKQYNQDRAAYAQVLHQGVGNKQFGVTNVNGIPIDLRMNDFADANTMRSCEVPGDI